APQGNDSLRVVRPDLAAAGADHLARRPGCDQRPAGGVVALPALAPVDGPAAHADGSVLQVLVRNVRVVEVVYRHARQRGMRVPGARPAEPARCLRVDCCGLSHLILLKSELLSMCPRDDRPKLTAE